MGGSILTLIFTGLLGIISIWYLTRNLREIVYAAKRFEEGDLHYRIAEAEKMDLAGVAITYNQMAETILSDIQKIKSLESLKSELIANISHDLRTPLSIIQGYIETLQIKDGKLNSEERVAYLNTIRKSSVRLEKLIIQLFEYSKLETNQIVPKKEPFLINDLVSDIQQEYSILAREKSISLELSLEKSAPQVFADISLVERAIHNLLENAIKFTPKHGKVIIEIKSEDQQVDISVHDNGPGIIKENQELIFERYRRTDAAATKEGSGLGLAIVKKIIEIHNSRIEVLSIPNKGTSFRFHLPVYEHSLV